MRPRFTLAAIAAAFVMAGVVPLSARDRDTSAHVSEKPHAAAPKSHGTPEPKTAEKPAAPATTKPRAASPEAVAENIMKAIHEYGAATTQPRPTPPPRARAPRYRVEWPAPRYTVTWPDDQDGVNVVWPATR
jgi:hypothetical protein